MYPNPYSMRKAPMGGMSVGKPWPDVEQKRFTASLDGYLYCLETNRSEGSVFCLKSNKNENLRQLIAEWFPKDGVGVPEFSSNNTMMRVLITDSSLYYTQPNENGTQRGLWALLQSIDFSTDNIDKIIAENYFLKKAFKSPQALPARIIPLASSSNSSAPAKPFLSSSSSSRPVAPVSMPLSTTSATSALSSVEQPVVVASAKIPSLTTPTPTLSSSLNSSAPAKPLLLTSATSALPAGSKPVATASAEKTSIRPDFSQCNNRQKLAIIKEQYDAMDENTKGKLIFTSFEAYARHIKQEKWNCESVYNPFTALRKDVSWVCAIALDGIMNEPVKLDYIFVDKLATMWLDNVYFNESLERRPGLVPMSKEKLETLINFTGVVDGTLKNIIGYSLDEVHNDIEEKLANKKLSQVRKG